MILIFSKSKLFNDVHSSKHLLPISETSSDSFTSLRDEHPAKTSSSSTETPLISTFSRLRQKENAPFSIMAAVTFILRSELHFSKAYFSTIHSGAFMTTLSRFGQAENAYFPIIAGFSRTSCVIFSSSQ